MKKRRIFATILVAVLLATTILAVFAAFRFEVQFPTELNMFTYDQSKADFTGSFVLDDNDLKSLSEPGQGATFTATVVGDKDVKNGDTVVRNATPLTYSYTINASETDEKLLSSIFVYLNGEILGTLKSLQDAGGLVGEGLYVLPNQDTTDTLRFELHLASNADPYNAEATTEENGSEALVPNLTLTITCKATNHNAQRLTFVNNQDDLKQAISEVNRGAVDKTIVMYGTDASNKLVITEDLVVTAPCTFDVQEYVEFTNPITVNIQNTTSTEVNTEEATTEAAQEGEVEEGEGTQEGEGTTTPAAPAIPTDIVTVLSTKSKCAATESAAFTIIKGAIDRKDSASNVTIDGVANANAYSVQYIIDNQLDVMLAHGIGAGTTNAIDIGSKGFSCYIQSITVPEGSLLSYTGGKLTAASTDISKVESMTVTLVAKDPNDNTKNLTHAHTVKVIGADEEEKQALLENELAYIKALETAGTDVSYSIPLPTVIKSRNATIEWHSSDPEKFSNTGVCSPSANGYVTLTAVIRINEKVYTQDFRIHIATLTNKDRLEAMIAAMGNIELSMLYKDTLATGNYADLPKTSLKTGTDESGYEQYILPADGSNKQPLATFDISGLTYSIDKATYGYIDLVEHVNGEAPDQTTHPVVVLRQSTFNTLAEVQVTATFTTGDSSEETSVIYVNIKLGNNTELGNQVLAYVRNKLSEVNVLQNMLDTRNATQAQQNGDQVVQVPVGEKGDFELPTEYSGFDIIYQIKSEADRNIVKNTINITKDDEGKDIIGTELLEKNQFIVKDGKFEIDAAGFKNVSYDVTVFVSVLIKGDKTISNDNVIASGSMTFTVPAAIHCDTTYGFSDSSLFQSVRTDVMKQQTTDPYYQYEDETFHDAGKDYILIRDIEKCAELSIDGEGVSNVCLNGLAYFTNLTKFEAKNFTGQASTLSRAAATFKGLTNLTLSNVELTDLSPVLGLNLTRLDVSYNAELADITGVAKYDATALEYLNISGTKVNMERTRSLLTAMYYKYESAKNKAPEYLYTHTYTPIADGALLLEPDAISVTTENGTTTATIAGGELTLSNGTVNGNQITIGDTGAVLTIDGIKSISIPQNTIITVINKNGNIDSSSTPIKIKDAIVSYVLNQGMDSTSYKIGNLWLSGTVTISNATVQMVNGIFTNTVVMSSEGKITSNSADDNLTGDRVITLTGGTEIPILGGVIQQSGNNVVITPLSEYNAATDWSSNNTGSTTIYSDSVTEIVITGASLSGTDISIGPSGGTITVKSTNTYSFAVLSNTIIEANTVGNMVIDNRDGTISIIRFNQEKLPDSAQEMFFSSAQIVESPVTNEGVSYIQPTIHIDNGCLVSIDGVASFVLSETSMPLPEQAIGTVVGNTVTVQTYEYSGILPDFSGRSISFRLLNVSKDEAESDSTSYNNWDIEIERGWAIIIPYDRYYTPSCTISPVENKPAYLVTSDNRWIPISSEQIKLTGDTYDKGNIANDPPSSSHWGTIRIDGETIDVTLSANSFISGSIDLEGFLTEDYFVPVSQNQNLSITSVAPKAKISTDSINPQHAGIRTILPDKSQSIAPNVVDYYGTSIQLFGCSLRDNTITANSNYQWYAILLDSQYITISDGAAIELSDFQVDANGTITPAQDATQVHIRITNGTSTIGKGALVTQTSVNVTHSVASSAKPTEIYAISGGTEALVKVTYQNVGTDDGLVVATIHDIRFEPIVSNDEEKTGVSILFLLSEVPGVSHNDYNKGQNNGHGTYIQLTPTVHYGNAGLYVSVTWSVDAGSTAYVKYADYYGSPRLETVRPSGLTYVNGEATVDVTIMAQVNVQGVVSYRYFTFTVTYYEN